MKQNTGQYTAYRGSSLIKTPIVSCKTKNDIQNKITKCVSHAVANYFVFATEVAIWSRSGMETVSGKELVLVTANFIYITLYLKK